VPPSRVNPEATSMLDFVVARALKKDPDLRYQDGYELASDLRTCLMELRGKETAAKDRTSRTQATKAAKSARHETTTDKAPLAPAAVAIAPDTSLPLSHQFDCAAALQRLARPGRRDMQLLGSAPRPVGLLRRIARDAGPRLFFLTLVVAGCAGAYIALP